MDNNRIIFHIDVNSAFLSWEAVDRLKKGSTIDLRKIPSAVGGDIESRRGIITAKSIPAKQKGVITGEPVANALRKCPNLYLVPSNFKLYLTSSKAFMDICRKYSSILEPYSIDECFIDLTGTEKIYGDPIKLAYKLKDEIKTELGFTVNIGIGPNKLLAKTAGDFEKPDKVHTLFYDELEAKYDPLDVGDMLYVGKKMAKTLHDYGVHTIKDLKDVDIKKLIQWFGKTTAYSLKERALGIDNSPVEIEKSDAKSISVATTTEDNILTTEKAFSIIKTLAEEVSRNARRENFKAQTLALTIRSNTFKDRRKQRKLTIPTNTTKEIEKVAQEIFIELWDHKTPLRLLGISLSDLIKENNEQLSLFENINQSHEKEKKIDQTIDIIRKKYGSDIIGRGQKNDDDDIAKKSKAKELFSQ